MILRHQNEHEAINARELDVQSSSGLFEAAPVGGGSVELAGDAQPRVAPAEMLGGFEEQVRALVRLEAAGVSDRQRLGRRQRGILCPLLARVVEPLRREAVLLLLRSPELEPPPPSPRRTARARDRSSRPASG